MPSDDPSGRSRFSLPGVVLDRLAEIESPEQLADEQVDALCQTYSEHATVLRGWFEAARFLADRAAQRASVTRTEPISILATLEKEAGARPRVRLRDPDAGDDGDDSSEPAGEATKYRILGEIGKGGVGVVYRGEDSDLGRTVALKFLQDRYRQHRGVVQRFVEEAQIGAQLQHPGIVPVYDLGVAGGRPFFAMKLVKGTTLAARLAARPSPRADLQPVLSLFAQVCQTIAYAHARGVVHRDLKPDNVLVGAFGEVQVVDWGMGKVMGQPEPTGLDDASADTTPAGSVVATLRSTREGTASVAGSVLGTPSYMAPEQANGQVERMDARTDVFALGAILCEILTGAPPYVSDAASETERVQDLLVMASLAELDAAHRALSGSGADPDLVELAMTCLAPQPDDRPAHAGDVAARVTAYLAGVEQRAQDAKMAATAARQRQRWLAAVAVTVLLGLAVSIYFGSAAARLAESERLAKQAAQRETERATTRFQIARDALGEIASQARDTLRRVPGPRARDARHELLRQAAAGLDRLFEVESADARDSVDAYRVAIGIGDLRVAVREMSQARASFEEAARIARRRLAVAADPDPGSLALALIRVSEVSDFLHDTDRARSAADEALRLMTTAPAKEDGSETAWIRARARLRAGVVMAETRESRGQGVAMQAEAVQALEVLATGDADRQRHLAAALVGLGGSLNHGGRSAEALDPLQRARALLERLIANDPDDPDLRRRLAEAYRALGSTTASWRDQKTHFEAALQHGREALRYDDTDPATQDLVASVLFRLGFSQMRFGEFAAALASVEESAEIARAMIAADPQNAAAKVTLCCALQDRGLVHENSGEPQKALESFREAVAVFDFDHVVEAGTLRSRSALSRAMSALAGNLPVSAERDALLERAAEITEVYMREHDRMVGASRLAYVLELQSESLEAAGRWREAADLLRRSLQLAESGLADGDTSAAFRKDDMESLRRRIASLEARAAGK